MNELPMLKVIRLLLAPFGTVRWSFQLGAVYADIIILLTQITYV